MAELTAKQGKDIILLYRLLSNATKEAAWKLAFQTEHSNEKTRDYNTTATKDGTIGSLAAIEYSLSATSIAAMVTHILTKWTKRLMMEKLLKCGKLIKLKKDLTESTKRNIFVLILQVSLMNPTQKMRLN